MHAQDDVRLSDFLGPTQVHHSAFLVRTGMLPEALAFFVDQLRWVKDGDSVVGGWGTAVFVRPPNTTGIIQLSEYYSRPPELAACADDNHLAIAVMLQPAQNAAEAIIDWAKQNGLGEGHSYEKANEAGTKWLVHLPAIFTFALEIVQVRAFRTS